MRILQVRRICQAFFLVLFLWSCIVTVLGTAWHQLRGWPVAWLLELDPLIGLSTVLASGRLYGGLLWGLVTLVLTLLFGRVFCGWVCPLGTLQQITGWLAGRRRRFRQQVLTRQYRSLQNIKYALLVFLLAGAASGWLRRIIAFNETHVEFEGLLVAIGLLLLAIPFFASAVRSRPWIGATLVCSGLFLLLGGLISTWQLLVAGMQSGLLDPMALAYRSIHLALLALVDFSGAVRFYKGAFWIALIFAGLLAACAWLPRFYCRFVCPLGALLGVLSRWALWRIGKTEENAKTCRNCAMCSRHCEGACSPARTIRLAECVVCMNCRSDCPSGLLRYRTQPSAAGEVCGPDLSRRAATGAFAAGLLAWPMAALGGRTGSGPAWNPARVRPPGAMPETAFLDRCIKCGVCMRICPTNVIQPALLEFGWEGLWTPVLDFRVGTSGCQHNCIACGHLCPTGALRPLSVDSRMGRGSFADRGPVRIGTAFVDRGRCLPWAMQTPCIVCQENCPVSPKAISIQTVFEPLLGSPTRTARPVEGHWVQVQPAISFDPRFAGGDFYLQNVFGGTPVRILGQQGDQLKLSDLKPIQFDAPAQLSVRLQQPVVDPRRCIGCGVCQHECPVKGKAAIRVSAENETRMAQHALLPSGAQGR